MGRVSSVYLYCGDSLRSRDAGLCSKYSGTCLLPLLPLFLPKPDVVRLDPDLHVLKVLSFSGQWQSS